MKKKEKTKVIKVKQKTSKFSIFLIFVDTIVLACFFLAYGPYSYFRDLLVTTAMTTMTHRYFAYVLYSEDMVKEVLDNNKIIEPEEDTDSKAISFNPVFETEEDESEEEVTMEEMDEEVLGIGMSGHVLQEGDGLAHQGIAIDARLPLNAQHMGVALPVVAAERDAEQLLDVDVEKVVDVAPRGWLHA